VSVLKLCRKCKKEKNLDKFHSFAKICMQCHSYKKYDYNVRAKMESKLRCCLKCDKEFLSYGNRKCDSCNSHANDDTHSTLSFYLSIG